MKKLLILILSGLCAVTALIAQPLEILPDDPRIVKGALANGLSYYLVNSQFLPGRADFYLVEKSGAALEEPGQAGMSAFLAQMSVRGSRNFPGTTLLDYFAELGLDLQRDFEIDAALEETIFRLSNVPVGARTPVMDSTLLVLYNWSCSLNLDEDDVQKAKVFFRNEYATRDSAQHRMNRRLRLQLLNGTQYENTFTTRLLDQVNGFTSKELRKFYYQWSRPDLQALIVVGDIDPVQVEMKIKTLFQTMPKAPVVEQRSYERTSLPGELQVVSATDAQASAAAIAFHFRNLPTPFELRNTAMPYLQDYVNGMTRFLLEERISRMKQAAGLPIWGERVQEGRFLGTQNQVSLRLGFSTSPDSLQTAVIWMARMLEQVRRDGFSQQEFDRARTHYLAALDDCYEYRKTATTNADFAQRCVAHYLDGSSLASLELRHALLHEADSLLSVGTFNTYVGALLRSPEDLTISMTGPDGVSYPNQAWVDRVLEVISEMSGSVRPVAPLHSVALPEFPEMAILPAVTMETTDPMSGATLLTFENGVSALLKPTPAEPGQIYFQAISKGGISLLQNASPLLRDYMGQIADLCQIGELSAADLAAFNHSRRMVLNKEITYATSALKGQAPLQEMETFLQEINLHFTAMQADPVAFDYFKKVQMAQSAYVDNNPFHQVQDTLAKYLHNPSTYTALSNPEDLFDLNYGGAVEFLKKLYANAASYTFLFVGDFDPATLKPMLARYLGSLPSNPNRRDNWQVLPYYLNKLVRRIEIPMDFPSDKAYYRITLLGESPNNLEDRVVGNMIAEVLASRLRQALFQVGVAPDVAFEFRNYPEEFLIMSLAFETEQYQPQVFESLQALYAQLQENGIEEADFALVKKVLKTRFELNQKTSCDFWMDLLVDRYVYGKDFYSRYMSSLDQMTCAQFNAALTRYLKTGGRLDLVLYGNDNYTN